MKMNRFLIALAVAILAMASVVTEIVQACAVWCNETPVPKLLKQ